MGPRRRPRAPEQTPPPQAQCIMAPQPLPGAARAGAWAPSSLGSKVFAYMWREGWADGWGQLPARPLHRTGLPCQAGPPAAPSVTAHPGPQVHPAIPLIPPPASSQRSGRLDAFSKFPGTAPSSSNSSPLAPSPPWEKAATARTQALSWAARGRSSWPAGSCEVWGCQGEEPRLGGRHGKATRECYAEPLPLAALFRPLCAERQMGLPAGPPVSREPRALQGACTCLGWVPGSLGPRTGQPHPQTLASGLPRAQPPAGRGQSEGNGGREAHRAGVSASWDPWAHPERAQEAQRTESPAAG